MNNYFTKREVCPVCNSSSYNIIYRSGYDNNEIKDYLIKFYSPQGCIDYSLLSGTPYILCECTNCSLIYQQYIPNGELMSLLYNQWINPDNNYLNHLETDGLGLFSDYALEIMRIISSIDKQPSELLFLDFGMGWGKWALMSKAFGVNSYGIEFGEKKRENGCKLGIDILDIDNLPENQFHFINTEQVFEHLDKPQEILSQLTASLRKGGIIKISVPNGNKFKKRYTKMEWSKTKFEKNSFYLISPLEHINLFTTKSLNILTHNHGLKPYYISIKKQLKYSINMKPFNPLLKNFTLPLKRNLLKNETYCLYIKN